MNRVRPVVRRRRVLGPILLTLTLAACGDQESDTRQAVSSETPVAANPAGEQPAPAPVLPPPEAAEGPAIAAPAARDAAPPPPPPETPVLIPPFAADLPAPEQVAPGVAPPAEPTLLERVANADPAAGERTAGFCKLCHTLGAGEAAGVGPNLYDIVGALAGRDPAFAYSAAIVALRAEGGTWSYDRLNAFLLDPPATVPGTGMTAAVRNDADRINLIAYLRTLSPSPVPVTERPGVRVPGLDPVAFTAEQVEAGRIRYAQCARCHAASLRGDFHGSRIGFAPTLIGDRFADRWFERTVFDFYARMEGVYLTDYNGAEDHGGRSPETYVALIAFILEQNGFAAGPAPLPLEREALERVGFWQ